VERERFLVKKNCVTGFNYIFTDGGSKFQPQAESQKLIILASNASIWHIPGYVEKDEQWGFLYQIDHVDALTGEKFLRAMHCKEMPRDKNEEDKNCTTLKIMVNSFACL
jgi:hypothetical protein